ncbi:MAG: exodeoxyribonuclease VII large subunit [Lachnospiraceae bacterium]|nr:exodeoxyribonuclease VII large subunit [Lachnospiraceae bacterium]HCJ09367.1 exodeoxyribonuclease VII large subunit [Lachnospiraceae bacterium]
MATVYSVSQVNKYIKRMFDNDFFLRDVQIKGEVSNVKYHSSGHIYFTLKEEGSSIAAVMFRSARAGGLSFTLENGQSVVLTGSVAVYERDGRYQIYVRSIAKDGVGNLYEAYELLKQKLFEEGLFDFEHKKEIPQFPKKIGIVTAKTGAAIQDIRNVARRRNPYVQLYLYPAKVQGDGAAATIVKGIETLDAMGMDTIIIGRGGGSIEDLWPFNEEIVARAIYAARTPIISGTGHEIDNTIADYAADLRAPTPSAACELAIPDIMGQVEKLQQLEQKLQQVMTQKLHRNKMYLDNVAARLERVSPMTRFQNQRIYVDSLQERLTQIMTKRYEEARRQYERTAERIPAAFSEKYNRRRHQFELLLARLDGLSPTAKLTGGYGYIVDSKGAPICSVRNVKEHDSISVTVQDGTMEANIVKITEKSED